MAIIAYSDAQHSSLPLSEQRKRLPIYGHRTEMLYMLEKYQVLILVGQTGSGKTTQIPQYLHEAGWTAGGRVVACTQPRRVAATTVAQRVADEMHVKLGMEVGYTIRFEDCTDPGGSTRIKYMTDGMLFREALMDPLLSKYSAIMVDEAHERSLHTDILLGVLKKYAPGNFGDFKKQRLVVDVHLHRILKKRPDLRLIVSSATLDAEAFAAFYCLDSTSADSFENAAILSVQGRMFPVDVHFLSEPVSDYLEATIQTVFDIHTKEPTGDILVFLTGREEIDHVVSEIRERATTLPSNKYAGVLALPIHAGLTMTDQALVFEATGHGVRKVVVATNIAEASITIPGIRYVVDSGFVKIRAFNPETGMEVLTTTSISRASAEQRAGRAGRIQEGKAYRLYTESSFLNDMQQASVPEIQRSNLTSLVLQLKALGIENVLRFDFMTSPPAEMMSKALELLYSLKALDGYGRLSIPLGMQLADFPLDPLLGKVLLESQTMGCSQEILTIAAMISVQNVFVNAASAASEEQHRKFGVQEGDHITLLNVYDAFVHDGKKSGRWCANHLINFKTVSRALAIRSHLERHLVRVLNLEGPGELKSCLPGPRDRNRGSLERASVVIRKCLVSGYFCNAAIIAPDGTHWISAREAPASKKSSGLYLPTKLWMHPTSILFKLAPKWVIFHEVLETGGKAYMREVTVVEPQCGSLRASLLNPHAAVQSSGQRLRFNSTIASPAAAADAAALNAIPLKVHNPQLDENGKELTLDITDNAVKQLKHVAARDDNPLQALRITVDSGGCHGYQYLMGLTDTVNDDDVVFEKDGARVIVDTITLPMISGSRIDFIEELIGSAFKVLANPNAAHSCGCDTSFEIKI
ncbi:hypothetical protein BGZ98_005744 [Dissophora globulifera]|nr:hypothetical protein BGZ98_005744 [Dissophora globulifera]